MSFENRLAQLKLAKINRIISGFMRINQTLLVEEKKVKKKRKVKKKKVEERNIITGRCKNEYSIKTNFLLKKENVVIGYDSQTKTFSLKYKNKTETGTGLFILLKKALL